MRRKWRPTSLAPFELTFSSAEARGQRGGAPRDEARARSSREEVRHVAAATTATRREERGRRARAFVLGSAQVEHVDECENLTQDRSLAPSTNRERFDDDQAVVGRPDVYERGF